MCMRVWVYPRVRVFTFLRVRVFSGHDVRQRAKLHEGSSEILGEREKARMDLVNVCLYERQNERKKEREEAVVLRNL